MDLTLLSLSIKVFEFEFEATNTGVKQVLLADAGYKYRCKAGVAC